MKDFLINATVVVVSTLIAIGGIEVGLRIFGDDTLAYGNQYAFYRFDEKLGWTNSPEEDGTFSRLEFTYPVDNNSLSMRDREVEPKRDGEIRVAVLGDSFVWGVGAAYGERFTEVMEQRDPAYNVLNFGVSGYNTVQELLALDQALELDPDAVVLALCLGNDFIDNVAPFRYDYHKPTAKLEEDGSVAIEGYPLHKFESFGSTLTAAHSYSRIVGMIKQVLRREEESKLARARNLERVYTISDRNLYLTDEKLGPDKARQREEVFDIAAGLIAQAQAKTDAAIGPGKFAVLLVPTKSDMPNDPGAQADRDPNAVGDTILARLEEHGIPVVDGREVIARENFWEVDGHWNPSGHEKIAEQLLEELPQKLDLP